jgi:PAT family beta-lactamase induction signal transducer AmpG
MARKGRASGWSQAGNIGSVGLGGGLGLWLTQHAGSVQVAAVALSVLCLICILPVLTLHEPAHTHRALRLRDTLKTVLLDLWGLCRSRLGLLALVLVLLPMGTGAAANLFAAIAGDWRTGADTVALVTGVLSGVASAAGALLLGFVADRFNRKLVFILSAISMALCTIAMAVLPRTPLDFMICTLLYAVTNGFMYTAYYAVAFEAIGKGAAATKAQLLGCAVNLPGALATFAEGAVQTRSGSIAMLWTETGMTFASIAAFGVFVWLVVTLWPKPSTAIVAEAAA